MNDSTSKVLSLQTGSQADAVHARVREAIEVFGYGPGDTGSSASQIAALSVRIQALRDHLKVHKKDKHNRRGLQMMVEKRKKHMNYLRRTDFEKYRQVTEGLGLR